METIYLAQFDSPIGPLRVASTGKGLGYVELPRASGRGLRGWLRRHLFGAACVEAYAPNRDAVAQILEYLEDKRTEFDLSLDLRGTPFQLEVWRELLRIPFGERRTYLEIAAAVGRPRACRAVGAASGANPLSLVVPCHRVIGSDGSLGGYAGGTGLKAQLLAMESRPGADRLL